MDTKKLRQKILDLAIHGKLVPQDPNDEPASVLLERIRAEKERLIKEGKIKRGKKSATTSDTPHYEQVPFEVPVSWVWCRLDSIGEIVTGSTPSKDIEAFYGGDIPFFKPTDLEQGINTTKAGDNLTELGFTQSRQLPVCSILVTCIGATIGKTGMIKCKGTCNQQINAIVPHPFVLPQYIYYLCISGYMQDEIIGRASATTLPILNKGKFSEIPIPLPGIQEQKRIVVELERWLGIVSLIESSKDNLSTTIDYTKLKILDLAIHGKLVPQDTNDEPAIELLKRINPKFTPCDNGHYGNIPNGWCECKLGEIANIVGGVSYDKNDVQSSGVRILRGGNIQDGYIIDCIDDVYIPSSYANKDNSIYKGDIVVVASTGSSTLIGKAAFSDDFLPNTQIGAFLRIVRTKDVAISEYIGQVFMSEYYRTYIRNLAKGSNINNIKNNYLTEFPILLPPLAEQSRIVTKIKELFRNIQSIMDCCS